MLAPPALAGYGAEIEFLHYIGKIWHRVAAVLVTLAYLLTYK